MFIKVLSYFWSLSNTGDFKESVSKHTNNVVGKTPINESSEKRLPSQKFVDILLSIEKDIKKIGSYFNEGRMAWDISPNQIGMIAVISQKHCESLQKVETFKQRADFEEINEQLQNIWQSFERERFHQAPKLTK